MEYGSFGLLTRMRTKLRLRFGNPLRYLLGNRLSRYFISRLVRRCPRCGRSAIQNIILKHVGENVDPLCKDCKRSFSLLTFLYHFGKMFGYDPFKALESFELGSRFRAHDRPTYIKGLSLVFEGIARFGTPLPITMGAPLNVFWECTGVCNLYCPYCFADDIRGLEELSTEEAIRLIDLLSEANVISITFSGGEPLMRRDFFELASYASKKGLQVFLATNGTLIDREIAKRLKEVGVLYVEISIDSSEREVHDAIRGAGSFEKAVNAVRYCVEAGILSVNIATTLTSQNKDIVGIFELAKNTGAHNMVFINFVPSRGAAGSKHFQMEPCEMEETLRQIIKGTETYANCFGRIVTLQATHVVRVIHETTGEKLKQIGFARLSTPRTSRLLNYFGGCAAGRTLIAVAANGDVYPCILLPLKLGNVREDCLIDIWRSSPVLEQMRDRGNWRGRCGQCKYNIVCGGCRARAYAYFGDFLAPDPSCILNADLFNQCKARSTATAD